MYLFLELNHCFVGDRRRCRGAEQIHAHIRGPFQHDPRATGTRPIRPTIGLVAGTCDPGAGAAGAGCGRCEAANIQGTTRAGGHARRRATARRLRGLRPLRGGSNAQALRNEFHGARAGGRAQGRRDGERLGNGGLDGAPRHVARWPKRLESPTPRGLTLSHDAARRRASRVPPRGREGDSPRQGSRARARPAADAVLEDRERRADARASVFRHDCGAWAPRGRVSAVDARPLAAAQLRRADSRHQDGGLSATARVDERLWPWVLQGVPSPLHYKWLRLYWKRALKVAGAPADLRLHDLRHCYGQWLADAGAPEARIQTGLRHTTAAMTRRYTMQTDKGESARTLADVMLKTA